MVSLSNEIKEYALGLGFCKAGITTAEPFDFAAREIVNRGASYAIWAKDDPSSLVNACSPLKQEPSARSLIVLAYDYFQTDFPQELSGMVGRIYQARAYLPLPGTAAAVRLQGMLDFLEGKGLAASMPRVLDRQAALRAGVARFGRNNFAFVDGVGSFVVIYTIAVDQELDYDEPNTGTGCDDNCKNCIRACPTGALYAPYKLKADRCIGFLNWISRYEAQGISPDIDPALRERMGVHIHGCDVCQEVCPQNRGKLHSALPKDDFLEEANERITLESLLAMEEGFYERYLHPLMHNYIKQPSFFQRNAAIAMGNTRDPQYVQPLIAQAGHADELVRAAVAWALGRIGGEEARQALVCCQSDEPSEKVMGEIKGALQTMRP